MKSTIILKKALLLLLSVCILAVMSFTEVTAITMPPPGVINPSLPALSPDISSKFTDANFKQAVWAWLGNTGAPGEFTKKDIENRLQQVTTLNVCQSNISSLAGLEYFEGLTVLYCFGNSLSSLPALPSTLKTLNCHSNQIASLPDLPSGLVELTCFRNNLSSLPALPGTLEILDCPFNPFAAGLPELPAALKELNCISCQLTSLPTLPDALTLLLCRDNQIKSLPILPNHLTELDFSDNQISFITDLPDTLVKLKFTNNKINSLPAIPATVSLINCENNYFSFSGGAVSALTQFTGTKTCTPQYKIIY
jgi:Leucine-rich repeat (LRR) protein